MRLAVTLRINGSKNENKKVRKLESFDEHIPIIVADIRGIFFSESIVFGIRNETRHGLSKHFYIVCFPPRNIDIVNFVLIYFYFRGVSRPPTRNVLIPGPRKKMATRVLTDPRPEQTCEYVLNKVNTLFEQS